MMARSTNAPFKGRIQKRKTNHLQIFTFGLQRTAGPYKRAKTGSGQPEFRGTISLIKIKSAPLFTTTKDGMWE